MSILQARLKTNWPLWGFLCLLLFVFLSSIPLLPEGKGPSTYWGLWEVFLSREWICSTSEFVWFLVIHALIRLIPSVVIAWVMQAIVEAMIAGVRAIVVGRLKE